MLPLRQIIPPVTLRAADGRTVRAWDFKQKRALVIAFLHGDCATCREYVAALAAAAPQLQDQDATALAVFPGTPDARVPNLPANIVVGTDLTGSALRAYLGKQAIDRSSGQMGAGVFITDRYGELFAQWPAEDGDSAPPRAGVGAHVPLPAVTDLLGWLAHIQMACG
jgi:hypothetical protein